MTKVRIDRGERRVTVDISGHADFKGVQHVDIVCAAASMLASTYAQHAQKLYAAGIVDMLGFEHNTAHVYVDFEIKDSPACMVMATTMIDVFKTGVDLLVEQYPKNVRLLRN